LSKARNAARLQAWACAEEGSRIDLMLAANACPDPDRAAAYLRHAHDEARHTRMFAARARALAAEAGRPPPPPARADTDALYDRLGEAGFLAFVAQGEARALADFRRTADALSDTDPRTAATLRALIPDEAHHAAYTRALLHETDAAPGALRRVRAWALWRGWLRLGRRLTRPLFLLLFASLAPLLALSAIWARAARPARSGWQPPEAP
jgi:hypothetical protein